MKNVCVFLADGCEEVEALTPIDLLRRAGAKVTLVSVSGEKYIKAAHNVVIETDVSVKNEELSGFDAYVLPGGAPGYKNLMASPEVKTIVTSACTEGKLIAAICAAPCVLGEFGLLNGKKATCYPGMEDGLIGADSYKDSVVVDGNIITSRGVGTAIEFSLSIIEYLYDKEAADTLAAQIVWSRP